MKNRILTFIIGILVGSIITTFGFHIYSKSINDNRPNDNFNHQNNQPFHPSENMGQPPQKPEGNMNVRPQ